MLRALLPNNRRSSKRPNTRVAASLATGISVADIGRDVAVGRGRWQF